MIEAVITDCEQGEKNLAKKNMIEVGKIIDLTKSIIIFDRGYSGIDLIWLSEKMGIKYIFRLQSINMIFVNGKKMQIIFYNFGKGKKKLIAINPKRSYIRKAYASGRNKYSTNIRYNM